MGKGIEGIVNYESWGEVGSRGSEISDIVSDIVSDISAMVRIVSDIVHISDTGPLRG